MKKLIPILIIFSSILMLSGCEFHLHPYRECFTFYFNNDTNYDLRDWYLLDEYGNRYSESKSIYANPISGNTTKALHNLNYGWYKVFYEFENKVSYTSDLWLLNSDTKFLVSQNRAYTVYY